MNAEDGPEAALLLDRAAGGDADAWGALLTRHQERLECVAAFRLDPRVRGRVDAADVIQEAFIVATARRADFFGQSVQPLFLWLRWIVGNTLLDLHRHHLGAQMRDPRREHSPAAGGGGGGGPVGDGDDGNTRVALIAQLTGGLTGPATAAGRAELKARLDHALAQMDAIDREVIALRHYEQLTSAETGQVLGIQERAAAKRYLRALARLRELLADMPGGLTGLRP
jgi:RNA polymerase sigma-70 factor (ECF subfamily)